MKEINSENKKAYSEEYKIYRAKGFNINFKKVFLKYN
jgi:hypothetical protein